MRAMLESPRSHWPGTIFPLRLPPDDQCRAQGEVLTLKVGTFSLSTKGIFHEKHISATDPFVSAQAHVPRTRMALSPQTGPLLGCTGSLYSTSPLSVQKHHIPGHRAWRTENQPEHFAGAQTLSPESTQASFPML